MASLKEFETALLNLGIEIDEIKYKGKDVSKAIGAKNGKSYFWIASGLCYARSGTRIPALDLKFSRS